MTPYTLAPCVRLKFIKEAPISESMFEFMRISKILMIVIPVKTGIQA